MLEMKRQGWVNSLPGRDGGFVLAKPPEAITMGEIVRHFDGILGPISCVSATHYEPCPLEGTCRFRRILLDIRNYTAKRMDEATLRSAFSSTPVALSEVFSTAYSDGGGI